MYEYCADWRDGKLLPTHEREARLMLTDAQRVRFIPRAKRVSVADAAVILGVSEQRIRLLLSQGRIAGARRGPGRNRPWKIPAYLVGGSYSIRLEPGSRGPENPASPRVPF